MITDSNIYLKYYLPHLFLIKLFLMTTFHQQRFGCFRSCLHLQSKERNKFWKLKQRTNRWVKEVQNSFWICHCKYSTSSQNGLQVINEYHGICQKKREYHFKILSEEMNIIRQLVYLYIHHFVNYTTIDV